MGEKIRNENNENNKYMKTKHLGYMSTVAATLLLASCSNDVSYDYEANSSYNKTPVDVTITVKAADLGIDTRAYDQDGNYTPGGPALNQTVGKGTQVDMIVYAVYLDESKADTGNEDPSATLTKEDHTFTLMTQYGEDEVKAADAAHPVPSDFMSRPAMANSTTKHDGQTVIYVGNLLQEGGSIDIPLRLMRNQSYVLALWAQSSYTDAYDTDDFRQIEVRYTPADANAPAASKSLNNDELRDAFCKAEYFSTGSVQLGTKLTVYLSRPLAQINVGTTGADYKYVAEKGAPYGTTYTYSTMSIGGVARFFDLVLDKVISQDDIDKYNALSADEKEASPYNFEADEKALTDVEFDWNLLPAYVNEPGFPNVTFPSDFDFFGYDDAEFSEKWSEEFLLINIDGHNDSDRKHVTPEGDDPIFTVNNLGYKAFKTTYPTATKVNGLTDFYTETFKYMSMCYVLVPSSTRYEGQGGDNGTYSSVLKSLSFNFRDDEKRGSKVQSLQLVPVRRNWRTNILGGLGENFDDSNSLFFMTQLQTILQPAFDGEYAPVEYEGEVRN